MQPPPTPEPVQEQEEEAPQLGYIKKDIDGNPIKKYVKVLRPLSLRAQREKLEFTLHLHNMSVIEDKCARFLCGVRGGTVLDIQWFKNDEKIDFEADPRVQDFSGETTGCIGIECASTKDAGKYTCKFTDKYKKVSLTTAMELIVVPRIHRTKELAQKSPPTFIRKLQCE